jgi:HlyD family secretion protein
VRVVADIETPPAEREQLGDGYRVEARIVVWEREGVLKIPTGCLFRRGPGWAVYVLEGGRAQLRSVSIGSSSGLEAQALEGLSEGEAVILYPGDRVQDGGRVRVVRI